MVLDINLSKQFIVNDVATELNLYGRTLDLTASGEGDAVTNLKELANYIRTPDDNETKPVIARAMQEAWDKVKECCMRFNAFGRKYDDNRLEAITEAVREEGNIEMIQAYRGWMFDTVKVSVQGNTTYHFALDFRGVVTNDASYSMRVNVGDNTNTVKEFVLDRNTGIVEFDYQAKEQDDIQVAVLCTSGILPEFTDTPHYTVSHNKFGNYNLQLVMPDNFNISVTSSVKSYAHRLIVDYVVAAVLKNQQQEGYTKYLATTEQTRRSLIRILQSRNSFGRVQHDWT